MYCQEERVEDADDLCPRRCGDCGQDMMLSAQLPRLGALPALRSYRCMACGNMELDVLEHFGEQASATAAAG